MADLLTQAVKQIKAEIKQKPYPTKREYDREVLQSIRRFQGRPVFDGYRVMP